MAPTIPLELQEEVICHLHDDKIALSSCSLTCKSWLTKSRSLLFHKITHSLYQDDWSLADFSIFLREHPVIATLIRELCIYHTCPYPLEYEETDLSSVVELLPTLQSLTVGQHDLILSSSIGPLFITKSRGTPLFVALSGCSHLQTLAFHSTHLASYAEWSYPDGSFPQLRNLDIYFAKFPESTMQNLLAAISRTQCEKHTSLAPPPCRLKRLTITLRAINDTSFGVYGSFLKDGGRGLEELVVIFSGGPWDDDVSACVVARSECHAVSP